MSMYTEKFNPNQLDSSTHKAIVRFMSAHMKIHLLWDLLILFCK